MCNENTPAPEATKEQERDALKQIKAIVADLGPHSYIATAFRGVFDIAEENSDNDFSGNPVDHAEELGRQLAERTVQVGQLAQERDEYKARAKAAETYPDGTVLTLTKEDGGWGYTGEGWVCLDYINKIASAKEEIIMDGKQFYKMFYEMRKEWRDNDASSYSEEARKWAVDSGLVVGITTGEFNGMWEDLLTREQMVTVLYRFAKIAGLV